jgi:hypothetical protein
LLPLPGSLFFCLSLFLSRGQASISAHPLPVWRTNGFFFFASPGGLFFFASPSFSVVAGPALPAPTASLANKWFQIVASAVASLWPSMPYWNLVLMKASDHSYVVLTWPVQHFHTPTASLANKWSQIVASAVAGLWPSMPHCKSCSYAGS